MDFISCSLRNFKCAYYTKPIEISNKDKVLFYLLYQGVELGNIKNAYLYLGMFGISSLLDLDNYFICYNQVESSIEDKIKRRSLINNIYVQCQLFSNALWFVKDNAATPYTASICSNQEIEPEMLKKNTYYTNAIGSYDIVEFTKDELNDAMSWYGILDDFVLRKQSNSINMLDNLTNMSSYISLDIPSFHRAFYYLDNARKTDFLPAKIASYISILECVTAAKGENVQKVCERIAYFIGNNFEERLEIYKDIKKLYDFRSSYVHGSQIGEKKDVKLSHKCKRADDIVRQVLSKMFTEHKDLNYIDKKDKNNPDIKMNGDVDTWFNELILGRKLTQ